MAHQRGSRPRRGAHARRSGSPQQPSDPRISALLAWYDARKRDLPWRREVSPYSSWVSEIMLQQTTVAAVAPKFERFLARFPDISALAAASEDDVLSAWAGLGYYSRARNLRAAAQKIVHEHAGRFPSTYESILSLPGVGRYTAGAIGSIAFGLRLPVLDGNVMRVFSRWFAVRDNIKNAAVQKKFWSVAEKLVPPDRPGDWNQALMELGATVCLPENPKCPECPVSRSCLAFRRKIQDRLPVVSARKEAVDLRWTCLWIKKNGKVLLWRRSKDEHFLKGLWGFPEARHLSVKPEGLIKTASHSITHHLITAELRRAKAPNKIPAQAAWIDRVDLERYLVSSLWTKLWNKNKRARGVLW
ncbi:MAG: A/G-specific adenine glycosylase [Elusimicrobia bacterium]|nr:A/G-specific adenine glycosylase [Elusimicrobiota bacterium]